MPRRREDTRRRYLEVWGTHLLDRIGGYELRSITPLHIEDLRTEMTSETRGPMLERNGYLTGVPCWVDTSMPDLEAAVAFYGGLFGSDSEDVMPPGSGGHYFVARLRGGDVRWSMDTLETRESPGIHRWR